MGPYWEGFEHFSTLCSSNGAMQLKDINLSSLIRVFHTVCFPLLFSFFPRQDVAV